jgi:hypothetical protein
MVIDLRKTEIKAKEARRMRRWFGEMLSAKTHSALFNIGNEKETGSTPVFMASSTKGWTRRSGTTVRMAAVAVSRRETKTKLRCAFT